MMRCQALGSAALLFKEPVPCHPRVYSILETEILTGKLG